MGLRSPIGKKTPPFTLTVTFDQLTYDSIIAQADADQRTPSQFVAMYLKTALAKKP